MDRKRLLGVNVSETRFSNVESSKDKFYKQLEKIGLDEFGVKRYSMVMNYSNQIDALNISHIASTCSYLYSKNEKVDSTDIEYITYSICNPSSYPSEEEFRIEYVRCMMTVARYFVHAIDCINKAKANGDIADLVGEETELNLF